MSEARIVFRPNPKDVPEIMRRQNLVVGQPFVLLPGAVPYHKVLGEFEGTKIRRETVEMVFNDALLMDFVYRGIGPKSSDSDSPAMAAARELAAELYGETGRDAQAKYGRICLECGSELPQHSVGCGAGEKNRLKGVPK
jgi:hypothetical protein